jgi:hypothetical protein
VIIHGLKRRAWCARERARDDASRAPERHSRPAPFPYARAVDRARTNGRMKTSIRTASRVAVAAKSASRVGVGVAHASRNATGDDVTSTSSGVDVTPRVRVWRARWMSYCNGSLSINFVF